MTLKSRITGDVQVESNRVWKMHENKVNKKLKEMDGGKRTSVCKLLTIGLALLFFVGTMALSEKVFTPRGTWKLHIVPAAFSSISVIFSAGSISNE